MQRNIRRTTARHAGERGLTLIELLVSVAILGVIGGVIGVAFSVGILALGHGGAGDRLQGAHDQSRFEQLLSQDVTRASCLEAKPSNIGPYGSCFAGFANATITDACTAAVLCAAWPQYDLTAWTCHVATYNSTSSLVSRLEYSSGSSQPLASQHVSSGTVAISVIGSTLTAPSGQTWISNLKISITNTGVVPRGGQAPPTDTLVLRPLASDPAGQTSAIGSSGPPC